MGKEKVSDRFGGIHGDLAGYHSGMLAEHGDTPGGLGWNGGEAQIRRFEQLVKVIDLPGGFSLHDVGCAYGALYDFLEPRYPDVVYTGWDVSNDMVRASGRCAAKRIAEWFIKSTCEPSRSQQIPQCVPVTQANTPSVRLRPTP